MDEHDATLWELLRDGNGIAPKMPVFRLFRTAVAATTPDAAYAEATYADNREKAWSIWAVVGDALVHVTAVEKFDQLVGEPQAVVFPFHVRALTQMPWGEEGTVWAVDIDGPDGKPLRIELPGDDQNRRVPNRREKAWEFAQCVWSKLSDGAQSS